MAKKLSPEELINLSGFPLQIVVRNAIASSTDLHGWSVTFEEHPWVQDDGEPAFIDLVAHHKDVIMDLVFECKRAFDVDWVFPVALLDSTETTNTRSLCVAADPNFSTVFTWSDVPLRPPTPRAVYCQTHPGDSGRGGTVESWCHSLVRACDALAWQSINAHEYDFPLGERVIVPILVTTARLQVCAFNPKKEMLVDGTIPNPNFKCAKYLRFTKAFTAVSNQKLKATSMEQHHASQLRTVFIVHAANLIEFLQALRPDGDLRDLLKDLERAASREEMAEYDRKTI